MSKSVAELRTSPRVGRPERSYQLCLAPKLVAEVQSLLAELEDAQVASAAQREGNETAAPPRRLGQAPAGAEIRQKLAALREELDEHTGTLTLRGMTEGDWRLWVDANPPRDGNERDEALGYGFCNADALIDNLGAFAHEWNGEALGPGDWEFLSQNAAPGDVKAIASTVVQMHETVVNLPKLLSSSLATLGE